MLARLRHPNICLFMGVSLEPQSRAIITELVSRGSLWDVLRTPGLFPLHSVSDRKNAFWPWRVVKKVLDGTCRGLAFLHSNKPPIIHRDLKSANLLLDESFNVKMCDFGLARLRDFSNTMTANVGTVQWMAPEVLAGGTYAESADMYSVGMILLELITGSYPFEGYSHLDIAIKVVQRGIRPAIPSCCSPALAELLSKCWATEPTDRPTAELALKLASSVIPSDSSM